VYYHGFNYCLLFIVFIYFFFQAEDGIRYFHVTGVQTCALPISNMSNRLARRVRGGMVDVEYSSPRTSGCVEERKMNWRTPIPTRSEERRVGKECRNRESVKK